MEWTPIVDCAYDATISVGTESSGAIDLTIQLLDFAGNDLAVRGVVYLYFSSDTTGDATSDMDSLDISTNTADGDSLAVLANNYFMLISESDGDICVTADDDGAGSVYANIVLPNGKIVTSSVVTFTE